MSIPPIQKQPPRPPSKKDRIDALLARVNGWLAEGNTIDEALEKLTPKQYDFLIDNDIDFDALQFTPEQLKAISQVKKAQRTVKPGGYNKVYPQSKQDLYNGIVAYVQSQGAEIIPREKTNFRDLDFTIDGTRYKIVLSNPRK